MPQDFVGRLNTDVTVVGSVWTRIIECKYMRSAFTTHQHGMTMFHPEHLRQIYAYLLRMHDIAGAAKRIHGVLQYPALDSDQSHEIKLSEFSVDVQSTSLSVQWRDVTKQLDAVALQPPCSFA